MVDSEIAKNKYVLALGYDDQRDDYNPLNDFGQEAANVADLLHTTFDTNRPKVITNTDRLRKKALYSLRNLGKKMTPEDMLFFYYSGHGLADQLVVPTRYRSAESFDTITWSKNSLMANIAQLPGKKIVILNTCHADYPVIPQETILLASSQAGQPTLGISFTDKLQWELNKSKKSSEPLSEFLETVVRRMHNFPLINIDNWQNPFHQNALNDLYERELAAELEPQYDWQRANVRSTMTIGGTNVAIDPRCLYRAS